MGPGAVDTGTDPGPGGAPARGDAGAAAGQHRIRKLDAPVVRGILRQPAITVAPGVTEAAVLHLCSLVARLRLANQEFHQAARKLKELCTALSQTQPNAQDSGPKQ